MFNYEDEEESFLDDILKKAYQEEEEEKEKERIKSLLHRNANIFYDEIKKNSKVLIVDESIPHEKKKVLLQNMLNLFVEFEEYEKCAEVHQWQELIKNVNDTRKKSSRV